MDIKYDTSRYFSPQNDFKDERDEMVKKAVIHINSLRASQNWQYINKFQKVIKLKEETDASLAIKINQNPFLAGNKNNDNLKKLLDKCHSENDFRLFFHYLKTKEELR